MASRFVLVLGCALAVGGLAGCGGEMVVPGADAGSDGGRGDGGASDGGRDGGTDTGTAPDGGLDSGIDAFVEAPDGGEDAGEDAAVDDASVELPDVMLADSGVAPCSSGWVDCDGTCRDLTSDSQACGSCDRDCHGAHAFGAMCAASTCTITACDVGYADVNHVADDGCEAIQDFALIPDQTTIVVSAGGSASLGMTFDRINGFPYGISASLTGGPTTLNATPISLTPDSRATMVVTASALATPGTYSVQLAAGATVAGTPFAHMVPITVQIVSTAVQITSVELLRGLSPLPMNQAPQGAGLLTLRVHGTGLLSVGSAELGTLSLTDVAGATNAQREWTFGVPHGIDVATGARPIDLVLRVSGAPAASFGSAVTLTDIHVDLAGNDASGVGTWASPVASIDRAFALAGLGDTVSIGSGMHDPSATAAPAGLVRVRGGAGHTSELRCTSARRIGLQAAESLLVESLVITQCDTGILVTDGTASVTSLDEVSMSSCMEQITQTTPGALIIRRSDFNAPLQAFLHLTAASAEITATDFGNVSIEAVSTQLGLTGVHMDVVMGNALTIGPSPAPSAIGTSAFQANAGEAIHVNPGATVSIELSEVFGSVRGLVVDAATVTATSLYARDNTDAGIVLTGASPSIDLGGPPMVASAVYANDGVGLRVTPTSGTAHVALTALAVESNGMGGISVQSPAGVTTAITMAGCALRDNDVFGLRIDGGTTTVAAGSYLEGHVARATDVLIDLVSGDGAIELSTGTWTLPRGTGLSIEGASRHMVHVGTGARTVTIDVSGHAYDGRFGIVDDRGSVTALPATLVRAAFIGSDGAMRTWSGTFTNTGSYSVSVSPRDLASWYVVHAGRLDFGAP